MATSRRCVNTVVATLAIVGRPNVGKSTLFNRLVGRRVALVDDRPGLTRDRREGQARLYDLSFLAIDTAGLEEADDDSLEARMLAQTDRAVASADLVLLVIDARAGLIAEDRHFANRLRKTGRPVLLVANKCEGRGGDAGTLEAFALGLGDPVAISAEHGVGMGELRDAIAERLGEDLGEEQEDLGEAARDRPLNLAIVGRPNGGKSTLINRLVGEERLLTGPEPGVTRDAIAVEWIRDGRTIRLVDTAGLRRRARISDRLEKLSTGDALAALGHAEIVILVVDGTEIHELDAGLHKQDLTIARTVVEEGRGLVIAINKWDAVEDRDAVLERVRESLVTSLAQIRGVPLVTISALKGRNLGKLMAAVGRAEVAWNIRVPTGPLNRWLAEMVERHPPPMARGRRVRLRYVTQVKARPPTFALFASQPAAVRESYLRYLVAGLRDAFGLDGVPIRIAVRKGKNPYGAGGD